MTLLSLFLLTPVLVMGEHAYTNRLVSEKSPYLLQHAHNPVDWYPWGDEAFAKAKEEGKPIFLSIGYATCHWCHVMERECFEDAEVTELAPFTKEHKGIDGDVTAYVCKGLACQAPTSPPEKVKQLLEGSAP